MKSTFILPLIACCASLALCTGARAQDAAPAPSTTGTDSGPGGHHWGHGGGGDQLARLTKALDLTPDQQAKIKPILDAGHTQMKAIHDDTSISDQDKRPKMKEVREGINGQINGILTPDQQKKFADLQAKMREHHHGPGGPDNGGPAAPAPSTSGS